MVVCGEVKEIMRKIQGGKALEIILQGSCEEAVALLGALEDVKNVESGEDRIRVEFSTDEIDQSTILRTLIENNIKVVSFHEVQVNLEDVFMKVTRGVVS